MTKVSPADLRSRLYEAYATQHTGCGGDEEGALVCRCDIRPLLPPPAAGPVVDLACGRGELVRSLQADGFDLDLARSSPPVTHGLTSAARVTIRQLVPQQVTLASCPVPRTSWPVAPWPLASHLTSRTLHSTNTPRASPGPRRHAVTSSRSWPARCHIEPARSGGQPAHAVKTAWPTQSYTALVNACYRIALAAETGMLRGPIVTQNLTFVAREGAVTVKPTES